MNYSKRALTAAIGIFTIVLLTGILLSLDTPERSLAAGLTTVSAGSDLPQSKINAAEHEALMVAAQLAGEGGVNSPHAGSTVNVQAINSTLTDFVLPGTQTGGLAANPLQTASFCTGCHSPTHIKNDYAGSMMTNGVRDPLFRAALVIANKDAGFGGDLCIRCHSPTAWLYGRASVSGDPTSTDGHLINADDVNGIPCSACHRMASSATNPPMLGEAPNDANVRAGLTGPFKPDSAAYLIDPLDVRRGPFDISTGAHQTQQTTFLRSAQMCQTCHDIDNPLLTFDSGSNEFKLNALNTAAQVTDRLFPLDRSYSEWKASSFDTAKGGVSELSSTYPGIKRSTMTSNGPVTVCQDCHMPMELGGITGGPPVTYTVGAHQWVGASVEWQKAISATWGTVANDTQFNPTQTISNTLLGKELLGRAAQLDVNVVNGQLEVKVTNNTGHKLPTGYVEGRQMWIEVYELKGSTPVFTSGLLGGVVGPLIHDPYLKVYEAKAGLTADQAQATGLPEGESFHIILNNKILKDNRIPPRGFSNAAFAARDMKPVGASYVDGQYWDTTYYPINPEATEISVRLMYQTASSEYIDFLSKEADVSVGDTVRGATNWGQVITTSFASNIGKPFAMESGHLFFPHEFVATSGVDTGNCNDETQPCQTIGYAIQRSVDGGEIRVAAGTYAEPLVVTTDTVTLSGGFTLTNWITPTWTVNKTILDGQFSYRPLTIRAENTTVSGFTIRNGNANSIPANNEHFGGGIFIGQVNEASHAKLFDLRLENNVASTVDSGDGGGLYATMGNTFNNTATLSLNNVTVISNTSTTSHLGASGGGLGINAAGNSPLFVDMTNVTVQNNTAGNDFSSNGGGIVLNLNRGTATIRQSRIINNKTAQIKTTQGGASYGGGLYLNTANLILENVLIAGNAGERGDAMWIDAGNNPTTTVSMNYVTIANNFRVPADAKSALHLTGSQITMQLTNTLISGNPIAFEAQDTVQEPVINLQSVLIDNNVGTVKTGTITLNGVPLRGAAAFVSPGTGNFHLTAASAAVDKGNNQPPLFDLDGASRPKGAKSDIGAYEFTPSNLQNQTITFNALPNKLVTDPPFNVSATASSGLAVSFDSTTQSVCTVAGTTVTLLTTGTCTIRATQGGNGAFNPAPPVSRSFAVTDPNKTNQTITFNKPADKHVGDAPFALVASASSGLPVTFTSNTLSICTVSGNTVTLLAAGTCSITASQDGNATFNPATPVTRSFAVFVPGGGAESLNLPFVRRAGP